MQSDRERELKAELERIKEQATDLEGARWRIVSKMPCGCFLELYTDEAGEVPDAPVMCKCMEERDTGEKVEVGARLVYDAEGRVQRQAGEILSRFVTYPRMWPAHIVIAHEVQREIIRKAAAW